MTSSALAAYNDALYRCRFCPMCKPAAEVANVTLLESHTTRARAIHLWRVATGIAAWGPREVELLYQSTLDSISQAFCVSHYPVSEYVAAARADVYESGLAPAPIDQALAHPVAEPADHLSPIVLLGSEAAELGDPGRLEPARRALAQMGLEASSLVLPSGALAYALGARSLAREQGERVLDILLENHVTSVIADGPQTLWAWQCLYPKLGLAIPPEIQVVSLTSHLVAAVHVRSLAGHKVLVHDSRAAALVAGRPAQAEAIQPGFRGDEKMLGEGAVYEQPREITRAAGGEPVYATWSRSLCKSCGADDGLWLTYPELANRLRAQRLDDARRLGATAIVTDSLLCASFMQQSGESALPVYWLPELVEG